MSKLSPSAFAKKWQDSTLRERAGSHEHFIDLCGLVGHGTPGELDPNGDFFTFDRGASKQDGGDGWADVWYKGHFGWEYKGKHKDLKAAYNQLLQYREDLDNPPLLVVSDMDRFEVHCNFTGSAKRTYRFDLADIAGNAQVEVLPSTEGAQPPTAMFVLKALFTDPTELRSVGADFVTQSVAGHIGYVAEQLRARGVDATQAAHFLMKVLFCFFAQSINLLPGKVFTKVLEKTRDDPAQFARYAKELFQAMANGGHVLLEKIPHFDGGLFSDDHVVALLPGDIDLLHRAGQMDWASVEPAIFGTLFERCLDPDKHAQIGRHYTYADDIAAIVEPVLVAPLEAEWASVAEQIAAMNGDGRKRKQAHKLLAGFQQRLGEIRVLDPACGSGNFLYVGLRRLMDLEKKVVNLAGRWGLELSFTVSPTQVQGLEINRFAHELASIVIWIGYLQWRRDNGVGYIEEPILKPIETIHQRDALIEETKDGAKEASWPEADFIIGNPPFLGGKKLRTDLGDEYVDTVFTVWGGRVPKEADLCCYWFEKARAYIERESTKNHYVRAGLLATQGIRGGANRRVLQRIRESGDIFMAWSDRDWVLDGAAVHVSMVGFDDGRQSDRTLDGAPVAMINPDLTGQADVTTARRLAENAGISFMGDTKGGAFDIDNEKAQELLAMANPHCRPNSDVVRPWVNGKDMTGRPRNMWIIDFPPGTEESEAALYEGPFEYVNRHVRQKRKENKRASYRQRWWLHVEARPAMREAIETLERYVATPVVAKHRLFVWLVGNVLPDHQLIVFARSDDYFFGVVQSRVHLVWADAQGTQLETRPRYTPTTCFETFPFPWPVNEDAPSEKKDVHSRISQAAAALNELRENWLSPERGSISAAERKRRTLTNLYNSMPTWLVNAHAELDAAVLDAYGWAHDITDEEMLGRLLELNLRRPGV